MNIEETQIHKKNRLHSEDLVCMNEMLSTYGISPKMEDA